MIGKLTFKMIKFIDFLNRKKYRYNKALFLSNDSMYRAKIINQYLRKFRTFCNKYPDTQMILSSMKMKFGNMREERVSKGIDKS